MRCILIEDNPQVRELIKSLLKTHCPDVTVVGEAESVAEGLQVLPTVPADLWLLDIELRDGTVFELLDQLDPALFEKTGLVFLTAFGTFEYVIQALHKSAIDYLLKPVDPDQLRSAVEKVRDDNNKRNLGLRLEELRTLMGRPEAPTFPMDKLPVMAPKGVVVYLNISDILYIQGEANISYIHTFSGKPVTSVRHLGFYKDQLEKRGGFLAISKQHYVNSRYIARYDPAAGTVFMTNGVELGASRRGGQGLLDFFRAMFQ